MYENRQKVYSTCQCYPVFRPHRCKHLALISPCCNTILQNKTIIPLSLNKSCKTVIAFFCHTTIQFCINQRIFEAKLMQVRSLQRHENKRVIILVCISLHIHSSCFSMNAYLSKMAITIFQKNYALSHYLNVNQIHHR